LHIFSFAEFGRSIQSLRSMLFNLGRLVPAEQTTTWIAPHQTSSCRHSSARSVY